MKRFVIETLLSSFRARHLLLACIPTSIILWFASLAGAIAGRFCRREATVCVAQLRYAFPEGVPKTVLTTLDNPAIRVTIASEPQPTEISDHAFQLIAKRVFRHVGASAGELLVLEEYIRSGRRNEEKEACESGPLQIVSTGDEIIENLLSSGGGAVGLSAHLGSFELLAAHLAQRGLKCSVIGRAPNYPLLEKVIREFRLAYGVEVIWSNAADAPRQLIHAVRNGRIICALIDQDTKWKSDFSSFFGLEAASPVAPIQLALRYNLPLFTSFIVRTSNRSHRICTESIQYDASDSAAISNILTHYNQRLESLIRLYPDQYIWWHRRWRRRPGIDYVQSPQLLRNTTLYNEWLDEVPLRGVRSVAAKK